MALSKTAQEVLWLRRLFTDLGILPKQPTKSWIFGDNQGSLFVAKNHKITDQVKHIDIRHHFIREQIDLGTLDVEHVSTKIMLADMFTKPLPQPQLNNLRSLIGIGSPPSSGSVEVGEVLP